MAKKKNKRKKPKTPPLSLLDKTIYGMIALLGFVFAFLVFIRSIHKIPFDIRNVYQKLSPFYGCMLLFFEIFYFVIFDLVCWLEVKFLLS